MQKCVCIFVIADLSHTETNQLPQACWGTMCIPPWFVNDCWRLLAVSAEISHQERPAPKTSL